MKRATAIKNLNTIVDRIKSVNGIVETPLCDSQYQKIKRVWVFGSVAKGSDNPNDLDIFIELTKPDCTANRDRKGRHNLFRHCTKTHYSIVQLHGSFRREKYYKWRLGVPNRLSSVGELMKFLKGNMKKISIHLVGHDNIFNTLDTKFLVYPRYDFMGE